MSRFYSRDENPSIWTGGARDSSGMRTRLKDVAEALKLSVSTVNAALQNRPDISQKTRERVLRKARELGYLPNRVARSLVTQRTQVIGVVVPDLSRSFFTEVVTGIDEAASAAGYHLLLCNTREDPSREDSEIQTLIGSQVDGLIIASAHAPSENEVWRELRRTGVPFVLVDRFFRDTHFVGGDDEQIGFIATKHLIQQGYERIAHIRGPNVMTAIGRLKGYTQALHRHNMRVRRAYIVEAQYHDETGGSEAAYKLLSLPDSPDAIFAASDPIAIGALESLQQRGLRIPEDFGLIGVGNVRYGQYLSVPLSTVDQQRQEIGKKAGAMLVDLITGRANPRALPILLEPRLLARRSSCCKGCVSGSAVVSRVNAPDHQSVAANR